MKKPKVCFLGYELHEPWIEGTRVLTRDCMRALDDAGVEVAAVSTRDDPDAGLQGFDVDYASPSIISTAADYFGVPGNNVDGIMFTRLAAKLRSSVSRSEADLVHAGFASHTIFSQVCKFPPSTPFVAHLFGKVEHQEWLERLGTLDRVDAYVTSSNHDISTLESLGVSDSKIHQISPPIYPTNGDRTSGRSLLGIDDDSFVVAYLGNADRERLPNPFLTRLNDFAADQETEAVIVTKDVGERREAFETASNVTVVEQALSEGEKANVYAAADVWMFPYDFEGPETAPIIDPPLSVLEALAAGRPVVTTRSLSLPRYVPEAGGVLCKPGDYEGIVSSLHSFREGENDPETYGANAREYAEEYLAPSQTARELEDVYQSVLSDDDG